MKNHPGVRGQDAYAVGCRGLTALIQNILQMSLYCQVSPQTLKTASAWLSLLLCPAQEPQPIKQHKSDLLLSHANHHALSETVCKNKTTNGQTFASLICQGPSVLHLSRAGKMDGDPSTGKKITTNFASEPASLLCFLRDSSGQRSIISFINLIIPCQIFSINFTHSIPAKFSKFLKIKHVVCLPILGLAWHISSAFFFCRSRTKLVKIMLLLYSSIQFSKESKHPLDRGRNAKNS